MNIPFGNIIGMGADNCSTMMGGKTGLKARFLEADPNIFVWAASAIACTYVPRRRLKSYPIALSNLFTTFIIISHITPKARTH